MSKLERMADTAVTNAIDSALQQADMHATAAHTARCEAREKAGTHPEVAATVAATAQVDALLALRFEIRAATLALGGSLDAVARSIWADPR